MAQAEYTDAIALLKDDHDVVQDLFEKFENASGKSRKSALAEQICVELKIHTHLEEEIFYPAFEGKVDEDDLKEAYVEHDAAKVIINDLMAGNVAEEYFDAKVKVLGEEINHHIKEEEERGEGLFAQARKTDVDLVALRDQMLARKEELKAQAENGGLPPEKLNTINADAS